MHRIPRKKSYSSMNPLLNIHFQTTGVANLPSFWNLATTDTKHLSLLEFNPLFSIRKVSAKQMFAVLFTRKYLDIEIDM